MKTHVDQAVRASKMAWLMESKRVSVTGEDISDERLKQLYLAGRKSYLRPATNPECVRRIEPCVSGLKEYGCFHDCMPLHASQMIQRAERGVNHQVWRIKFCPEPREDIPA